MKNITSKGFDMSLLLIVLALAVTALVLIK